MAPRRLLHVLLVVLLTPALVHGQSRESERPQSPYKQLAKGVLVAVHLATDSIPGRGYDSIYRAPADLSLQHGVVVVWDSCGNLGGSHIALD